MVYNASDLYHRDQGFFVANLTTEDIIRLDRSHIWHPYTSFTNTDPLYAVESARGIYLNLSDGRQLIDGVASWWCAIHGYNHPKLNEAIQHQLTKMSHVMFGGLTHEPAVKLAQKLVEISPENLQHVFFCDSGSVSIEVAIKMALQYWQSQNQAHRSKLLTIRNGYHGDTLGAMSVCDPTNGMHHLFNATLPQHYFASAPPLGYNNKNYGEALSDLKRQLEQNQHHIAAVILEPIVQNAGGIRVYSPDYLFQVRQLCDEYKVLLITDEIATGFGRTGKLFACEHALIQPDIMCIGKAITGGYLSFAATLCTEDVSRTISSGEVSQLMHGPTFMANPLACSVALANIDLLLNSPWQANIQRIEQQLCEELNPCIKLENVTDVRVIGAIGVVETKKAIPLNILQPELVKRGVWLRPFGKLIYTMPPYIIQPKELSRITSSIADILSSIE